MIGKLLGHTQVQTTARYAHLQDAPMHEDPDRLMNEVEAAQILGYTIRCLQNWRLRGGGPRFVKVSSRSIRYRRRDLNEWIESKLATSTSEMCNG